MMARRRAQAGSLLIITLWLITILSMLAVAIARYLAVEVRLTKYRLAREQAKTLARSGIYLMMQRLSRDAKTGDPTYEAHDWLGDNWALPQDDLMVTGGRISVVSVVDEERRLNINGATKDQLGSLTGSSTLAAAIVAYRDANTTGETPVDEPPYYQKNTPVKAMEELADIPDMKDADLAKLQQLTSASTDATTPPTVNINTVEGDVLVVLGWPTSLVDVLLVARPGPDGVFGTADDCTVTDISTAPSVLEPCTGSTAGTIAPLLTNNMHAVVSSSVFRIQVEASAGSPPVRQRIEAIIKRASDGIQILAWRER